MLDADRYFFAVNHSYEEHAHTPPTKKKRAKRLPVQMTRAGNAIVLRLKAPWQTVLKDRLLRKGFFG